MGELLDSFRKNAIDVSTPRKDRWDKASIVLAVVSAISVAIISALTSWFVSVQQAKQTLTQLRQQNEHFRVSAEQKTSEIRISSVQVVEKFFPHLSKDPLTKKAAIEVIGTINPELAARLGSLYFTSGGGQALRQLAQSADQTIAQPAKQAIVQQLAPSLPSRSEVPRSTASTNTIKEIHLQDAGDVSIAITVGIANAALYRVKLFDEDGNNPRELGSGSNLNQAAYELRLGSTADLINKIVSVDAIIHNLQSGSSTAYLTVEFKQAGSTIDKVVRSQSFDESASFIEVCRFVRRPTN